MSMRMPPQAAETQAFPEVNRGSLVFFLGFALILLNFYLVNGSNLVDLIFKSHTAQQPVYGVADTGLQVLGLGLLVLLAQYGGEGAGSFALVFIAAVWLLWLVGHFGMPGAPAARPAGSPAATRKTSGQVDAGTARNPLPGGGA